MEEVVTKMIKLKELLSVNELKYTDSPTDKQQKKMEREISVFHNISIPFKPPPDNLSHSSIEELHYLESLESDVEEVKKGDDIIPNFTEYLNENDLEFSEEHLKKIKKESSTIILRLKYKYNRPRPHQLAEFLKMDLDRTEVDSMKTPSYPSGHTIQSHLISKYLSRLHPNHTNQFHEIADRISKSRMIAKAHYPSDIKFGKVVAEILFNSLK